LASARSCSTPNCAPATCYRGRLGKVSALRSCARLNGSRVSTGCRICASSRRWTAERCYAALGYVGRTRRACACTGRLDGANQDVETACVISTRAASARRFDRCDRRTVVFTAERTTEQVTTSRALPMDDRRFAGLSDNPRVVCSALRARVECWSHMSKMFKSRADVDRSNPVKSAACTLPHAPFRHMRTKESSVSGSPTHVEMRPIQSSADRLNMCPQSGQRR